MKTRLQPKAKYSLGEILRDKITGFQGFVESIHIYLDGRVVYYIAHCGMDIKHCLMKSEYFDQMRLRRVSNVVTFIKLDDNLWNSE